MFIEPFSQQPHRKNLKTVWYHLLQFFFRKSYFFFWQNRKTYRHPNTFELEFSIFIFCRLNQLFSSAKVIIFPYTLQMSSNPFSRYPVTMISKTFCVSERLLANWISNWFLDHLLLSLKIAPQTRLLELAGRTNVSFNCL
jgi:hypothetical protein